MSKRQRNYTASERALFTIGAAAGVSLEEINEVLKKDARRNGGSYRSFHPTSYGMATRYPAPEGKQEQMRSLWDHILHPKTLGEHAKAREEAE